MSQRTSDSLCLLCQVNKATQTGSHMLPASLIASMIGPRDKEEGYVIKPTDIKPISSFYGRSNLKNSDPVPQKNEFVKDFFFCPQCEKRLAVLEGEINPVLVKKIKDPNQKVNFPDLPLNSGIAAVQCNNVNSTIFRLYIFSLIWRMCLLYRFKCGNEFLASPAEVEWFRKTLNDSMGASIKETLEKSNLTEIEKVSFVMFVCLGEYNKTMNMAVLHPGYRKPYCLILCEYLVLFSFTEEQLSPNNAIIILKDFKVDQKIINTSGIIKIALSKLDCWKMFLDGIWNKNAEEFKLIRINEVMNKKGLSFDVAKELIEKKAKELEAKSGKSYAECYVMAFEEIIRT